MERNQNMAEHIDELLREARTWFVVGAGHMVGEQGIPTLLAGRGHRIVRIPKTPPGAPGAPPGGPVPRRRRPLGARG